MAFVLNFEHLYFEFDSCLVLRISDFPEGVLPSKQVLIPTARKKLSKYPGSVAIPSRQVLIPTVSLKGHKTESRRNTL